MTKEKLEQEAEMFVSEKADKGNFDIEQFGKAYFSESSMKLALVKFAEKHIDELKAQIEKMKCCGNCKKLRQRFDRKTNINILYCSDSDMRQIEVGFQMCCCKWEIKEK